MAACKVCGEETDELIRVKVNGKQKQVCEECAEEVQAEEQIAQESEAAVQNMMGFKGRR